MLMKMIPLCFHRSGKITGDRRMTADIIVQADAGDCQGRRGSHPVVSGDHLQTVSLALSGACDGHAWPLYLGAIDIGAPSQHSRWLQLAKSGATLGAAASPDLQ